MLYLTFNLPAFCLEKMTFSVQHTSLRQTKFGGRCGLSPSGNLAMLPERLEGV
jgi:hypothetical protein